MMNQATDGRHLGSRAPLVNVGGTGDAGGNQLGRAPNASADRPIRVVLFDDQQVVREGLRRILESGGTAIVVGQAGNVQAAHALLEETQPDVVVIDVGLPDDDGMKLCREISSRYPDAACLVLTAFPDEQTLLAAVSADAVAYLGMDVPADHIIYAVSTAARGGTLLAEDTVQTMLDDLRSRHWEGGPLGELTLQEERIFELVGLGLSNRQIGERMHLAESTVRNYVSHVLSKLDMHRRTEIAIPAARLAELRAHRDGRHPDVRPQRPSVGG